MTKSLSSAELRQGRVMGTLIPALSSAWIYFAMSAAILALDLVTGRFLMFPILFVVPVALSAWFYRRPFALLLAVILPVGRLCIATFVEHAIPLAYATANASVRVAVLALIALLVARIARLTKTLQREVHGLEKEIVSLRSLLKPALAVGNYTPQDGISDEEFAGRLRRRLGSVRGPESGGFDYVCDRNAAGDYTVSLTWQSTDEEPDSDRSTMSVTATGPTETLAFLRAAGLVALNDGYRKELFRG